MNRERKPRHERRMSQKEKKKKIFKLLGKLVTVQFWYPKWICGKKCGESTQA